MAEYETINSFPVVDQARLAARNYGRSILEALSTAYEATVTCLSDSLSHCLPSLRRSLPHDTTYDWEDNDDARLSDELERLLDSEGQTGEDSSNTLSVILSRLPFVRQSISIPYKPSAANLRRSSARNKSRSSIHSNGSGGTGESLRSRADLFDHSGDEFEDAGMLPDERIFALTSGNAEEPHPTFMTVQSEVELQDEDRLAEQREEAILQTKRERAQRLAVKRGLSDALTPVERPRSAQGTLRDAIPLRRGRSSTLQSQVSDVVPLRRRSSTFGSQSSGLPSPKIEQRSRPTTPPQDGQTSTQSSQILFPTPEQPSLQSPAGYLDAPEEQEFSEFVQAASLTQELESSPPTSPISPKSPVELQTLPIEIPSSNGPSHIRTDVPLQSPSTLSSAKGTPTTPNRHISTSPPQPKRTVPENPPSRRTPSKVPGDYDPVTGYYRRKSDADIPFDEDYLRNEAS